MRSRILRALAASAAAAILAGGAAVTSTGTAFATPTHTASVAQASQHAPTAKKPCKTVKGYYKKVTSHGKTTKVWVKPHKVCPTK
jgi:hypothetical protein